MIRCLHITVKIADFMTFVINNYLFDLCFIRKGQGMVVMMNLMMTMPGQNSPTDVSSIPMHFNSLNILNSLVLVPIIKSLVKSENINNNAAKNWLTNLTN